MPNFSNKVIVITGASSGIGRALAVLLSNSGYNVLAVGRNEVALQQIKLLAPKGKVTTVSTDLSKEDGVDKVVNNIKANDHVHYLIHCAATAEPHAPLSAVTRADIEKIINVNVIAPILLTKKLEENFNITTRILFIGSDYVGVDNKMRPGISALYGMSKSALRVAVEYYRQEYKEIALVGYLNPGSTDTAMYREIKSAVMSKHGIFNTTQPASPYSVAKFIQAVLENTSDNDYQKLNWDIRNTDHQEKLAFANDKEFNSIIKSKL